MEVVVPVVVVVPGLHVISPLGEVGCLLFDSLVHELDVLELLFGLLLFLRRFLRLGQHAHVPVPIYGRVVDFGLEGNTLEAGNIELHGLEFFVVLQLVLESDVSGNRGVSDESLEVGLVFGEDDIDLVSELECLVNLDLELHLEADDFVLEDRSEILADLVGRDSRHSPLGLFDKPAQGIEFATLALDRDHVDDHAVFLRDIADLIVELVALLGVLPLKASETLIGESVSAKHDHGAGFALGG